MAYFIGPSGNFVKTFTIAAADRHVTTVAFFVLNMLSTKTLKFYNGASLLATSASITAGLTMQTILTTVDLTGVSLLTVKTSTRTLIVIGENFDYNTDTTFPGLSILNFRYLPEAVCPSVVATDFTGLISIDANGFYNTDLDGGFISLPFTFSNGVVIATQYGIGDIAQFGFDSNGIQLTGSTPKTIFSNSLTTDVRFVVMSGGDRFAKCLIIGWN
jgi:hypothetical protein